MSVIKINPEAIIPSFPAAAKPTASGGGKEDFGDFMTKALNEINSLQNDAGEAQDKLVRGEATELHQVMIAAEKAGLSFDLLLEIRRKLLDAYQEIIRMPV